MRVRLEEFSGTQAPDIREDAALAAHHGAAKALGLLRTTLHQHRHAFSVMHLKRGCDHQWLKNQLGHALQSTLLYTTYGLYFKAPKLTAQQHARQIVAPAPNSNLSDFSHTLGHTTPSEYVS
jgi:integrase